MTPTWRETDTWPSEAAVYVSGGAWIIDWYGGRFPVDVWEAHHRCRRGTYMPDVMQFGVPDLWRAIDLDLPPDQRRGDCEDYALGFMIWCARQGVPAGSMRMLIGLKRYRKGLRVWREGHAIVLIRTTDGDWISDIEAPALFKQSHIFNTRLSAYLGFRPAAEVVA